MAVTAHRAIDRVDQTTASQASRSMARPPTHNVLTLPQEYQELVNEKREIELKLQGYSKNAFAKRQKQVRATGGNTLVKWIDARGKMEEERNKLIAEKNAIEARLIAIKPAVSEAKMILNNAADPEAKKRFQIAEDVRDIKLLMERLCKRFGC